MHIREVVRKLTPYGLRVPPVLGLTQFMIMAAESTIPSHFDAAYPMPNPTIAPASTSSLTERLIADVGAQTDVTPEVAEIEALWGQLHESQEGTRHQEATEQPPPPTQSAVGYNVRPTLEGLRFHHTDRATGISLYQ